MKKEQFKFYQLLLPPEIRSRCSSKLNDQVSFFRDSSIPLHTSYVIFNKCYGHVPVDTHVLPHGHKYIYVCVYAHIYT